MLTAVAPTPARKSRIVLLNTRTFLPLKPSSPRDHVATPEHLRRVAAEGEELGAPVLLHLPVDHVAIGIARRARLVGIERQPSKIARFEARIVARHLGDIHAGEIHHAELQQPQHRLVIDAHLIERRDVGGDRAFRRLDDGLAPERYLVLDRRRCRAVEADHLELVLRQILRGDARCERASECHSGEQTAQHVWSPLVPNAGEAPSPLSPSLSPMRRGWQRRRHAPCAGSFGKTPPQEAAAEKRRRALAIAAFRGRRSAKPPRYDRSGRRRCRRADARSYPNSLQPIPACRRRADPCSARRVQWSRVRPRAAPSAHALSPIGSGIEASVLIVFLPASQMMRVGVGRLVTLVMTVSA